MVIAEYLCDCAFYGCGFQLDLNNTVYSINKH